MAWMVVKVNLRRYLDQCDMCYVGWIYIMFHTWQHNPPFAQNDWLRIGEKLICRLIVFSVWTDFSVFLVPETSFLICFELIF